MPHDLGVSLSTASQCPTAQFGSVRRLAWPREALQPVPVERSPIWDHPEVWLGEPERDFFMVMGLRIP